MRVMQRVLFDCGLTVAYNRELAVRSDVQDIWVDDPDSELDESSDMEDPEKKAKDDLNAYKQEMTEKELLFEVAVLETARRSVENNQVWLELERARMEREDLRGQLLHAK